jgi:hypothetical protein
MISAIMALEGVAEVALQMAEQALTAERWTDAVGFAERGAAADANGAGELIAAASLRLARRAALVGDFAGAVKLAETACKADPRSDAARRQLALLRKAAGRFRVSLAQDISRYDRHDQWAVVEGRPAACCARGSGSSARLAARLMRSIPMVLSIDSIFTPFRLAGSMKLPGLILCSCGGKQVCGAAVVLVVALDRLQQRLVAGLQLESWRSGRRGLPSSYRASGAALRRGDPCRPVGHR